MSKTSSPTWNRLSKRCERYEVASAALWGMRSLASFALRRDADKRNFPWQMLREFFLVNSEGCGGMKGER